MPDDEITDEGKAQVPAGGQQASPVAASGAESQPLPAYVTAMLKRIDDIEKLAKGVQKGTDKQINQVNASIERILELAKEGKTKPQIERELLLDRLMQDKESAEPEAVSDKRGKQTNSPDIVKVVDEVLGLPENDSRVTDLKLKHGNDPKAYLSESLKLLASLGDQSESTPGEQPVLQGRGAPARDDNPIKDIDDPKTLYRLAAKQMAQRATGRKRAVVS